jgi:SAM-dependent methyltransferase
VSFDNKNITKGYSSNWEIWIDIAKRQEFVSGYLFPVLLTYFQQGSLILELGAGVGQLCEIAEREGYEVVGSDFCEEFIQYMENKISNVRKLDALNIMADTQEQWFGIYAQGLSVLITKDLETVRKAYGSIFEALKPGGRFLFIFPRADRSKYSRAVEHRSIYKRIGFKEIALFRQQALPAKFYKYKLARTVERVIGKYVGIRDVIVLEK